MRVYCIIPVYNTSRYLYKSINSVLRQSYRDMEIILVNDASTDSSATICSEFQSKFPDKIHFINKTRNEGVDKARFSGLNYIFSHFGNIRDGGVIFLDSDDYISKDAVRQLVRAMKQENSDVVQMRTNRVMGFIKKPYRSTLPSRTIKQPELFENYYISFFGVNILDVNMWAKLYSLEPLRKANLSPSGFKMGEDLIFNLKLFPYLKKYTIIDYYGYNYRVGGLTSRYNPTLWSDLKSQYQIKRHEAEIHNYNRAYRTLAIELKNILKTEISQRIFFLNETDYKLINWIDAQIKEDIWNDLRHELPDSTDTTTQFIIEGNAKGILNDVRESMKQNWKRLYAKQILMKILK